MAQNKKNPTTKVNPLDAGLGIEGLKGYNPQEKTQEIKKESQVYTVTKNNGTQVDKSYSELTPAEKKAITSSGIVSGGKTDIERQYGVVSSSIGEAPQRNIQPSSVYSTLGNVIFAPAVTALGGLKHAGPAGAAFGAAAGGISALISFIAKGAEISVNEQKYQEALREYNKKIADNMVIAGSWEKDDKGNMIFMPDYSKVGEDVNVAASGAKIANLFDLENGAEPNVYFTDDGVLNVDINGVFAGTKKYKDLIKSISSDYAGLTKDTADVDKYLSDIEQRLSSALNQYRFEVNRVVGYKNRLPNASTEAIMDASLNEIGAILSDEDKKDWRVKVYRNGKIVESNAKEVLDHVYNMDKGERNNYIESLHEILEDDSVSDDDKAYVLAEYNLLFNASRADVEEGEPGEERKKYYDMLKQDIRGTILRGSERINRFDRFIDGISGGVSQGTVDDIFLSNQEYLYPDEVAQNIGAFLGVGFDIFVSQAIMQGVEGMVVRPILGSLTSAAGRALFASGSNTLSKVGEKMLEGVKVIDTVDRAGAVTGYSTTLATDKLKDAALKNIIQGFGSEASGLSYRLLAKGGAQFMFWSGGEFAINAASDVLYDATKLGTAIIAGDIKNSDEAAEYFNSEIGQDIAMDLIFQYGPMGMLDAHSSFDAVRLQNIEPYARGVAEARANYTSAASAVDVARTAKASAKEISRLESEAIARKNDLTKAEVDYAEARSKWVGGGSQKLGAKIAGLEAKLSENVMYRKFQEAIMDEDAASSALSRAVYYASGGDVELYNKLLNTASNNIRTLTRITANELAADRWAKGTGEAYNAFRQKYSDLSNYAGKMSKADINYIKAKNELIRYTEAAKGDKEQIARAEANYAKYIDAVSPERAAQLDELMDTMRDAINKTNESAINAGIETEENIQTKRSATGFQEQGYIPMYLKRKKKTGRYVIGQERNLDHAWDRGEFWDINNLENPVLNTLTYMNYTAHNIAVNERNKALIAATEIPGMSTYRTDADNVIIKTEDGHAYKHSDIIGHMEPKIDKRIGKLSKIKRETPTELEFADEKNKILYGDVNGTHEKLADDLKKGAEVSLEKAAGNDIDRLEFLKKERAALDESYRAKKQEQEEALKVAEDPKMYKRFKTGQDLSDKFVESGIKTPKDRILEITFDDAIARNLVLGDNGMPRDLRVGSGRSAIANRMEWLLNRAMGVDSGRAAFAEEIKNSGGDAKKVAYDIANEFFQKLVADPRVEEVQRNYKKLEKLLPEIARDLFTESQMDAITGVRARQAARSLLDDRQQMLDWWNATEGMRRRLGVESYTYGYRNRYYVSDGGAYGNYDSSETPSLSRRDDGTLYTVDPQIIRIALDQFDSLPEMKSTIMHESAHAAFSKVENRVPLVNDALRMMGVDAKVSEKIAASNDASELIAYMTQKKYLSELSNKTPNEVRKMLETDEVVQKHLNNITEMIENPPASFKERFLDHVRNIITFVKAKLSGNTSLRNVKTLEDFYSGLISGRFASDMRIDQTGSRYDVSWRDKKGFLVGDIKLDWSRVAPDAEEMALELIKIQEKIDANQEAQLAASRRIEAAKEVADEAVRSEVNGRIKALEKYYNDTYGKFGYNTSVRANQNKIRGFIANNDYNGLATYLEGINSRAALARPTDQTLSDIAFEKQVKGLEIELNRSMNKNFPGLTGEQKREVYARVLSEFKAKAIETGNLTAEQVANETFVRNVGYPITYYEGGEEKTAYIDGPLAKPVYELCTRSENVADKNFIQNAFEGAAKLKRYATSLMDATRALPNLLRDTLRGDVMSGGTDYAGARKIFTEILNAENLTAEQKAKAMDSIELAIKVAQGETLNAAIENRTERGLQDMVRETRQEGKNVVSRVIWDVAHGRIGHALETPMNVAETFTRRRMAQSAYVREFKNAKYTSLSFEDRLAKAYDAGVNAGVENTTNFSRRGSAVGIMARYVPYFQQNFANIESANIAFLKDPAGVAARAAIFQYAYIMMLADTLKREETRRAYYNLSDYDRKNNLVFSLDGETLVTIPVDESLSVLITPWRRTIETLNGIDPATFAGIFTDTLLDLSPIDLDGFTEGDGINIRRGMEKIVSQGAPSLITGLIQTITGYNLYYGSDNAVTDATLSQYGQVADSAGDYTTAGANSKLLRKVSDATGIPQWQLQQTVINFGGNVGQYFLNIMDRLAGATEEEQGGKDFVNAVFKSMMGSDTQNVKNQFYNGLKLLEKEKVKVVNKLQATNEKIATATGAELADLKKEYQQIKDDYGQKVCDFVDQYLNAYEITGGLEKKQASQIYYLFNLYDDNTVYESGSVGEYYQNLARQQAYNEADPWAAPILDKYYDQTQNVYKDANGTWHYSSPYGEQAYYNTIYGQGMKHQVGLRNLLEGATENLKSARSAAYEARSAAIERKDYDLYDQIGADFDAQVVKAIAPYIREYGADNVINNSSVLDYLEEWFFVPSSYMKTKKGRYVPGLAHGASKQRAFVRSYIKSLYNINTGYVENNRESLLNPEVF